MFNHWSINHSVNFRGLDDLASEKLHVWPLGLPQWAEIWKHFSILGLMEGKRERGRCQMIHYHLWPGLGTNRGAVLSIEEFPPCPVQMNARHLAQAARPFSFRHTVQLRVRTRVKPLSHFVCAWLLLILSFYKKLDIINHCQSLHMDVTIRYSL